MSGLKRLEYRGYDSAGVAIFDQGKIKTIRAPGKLNELEKKLVTQQFSGCSGIGHTRWATHGVPCERNAHPHRVKGISVVHNGIFENHMEYRQSLLNLGTPLESDTDTEIVAHLIAAEVEKTGQLIEAVRAVVPMLKGAYSVLVLSEDQPDTIVAFKNGPPLIIGLADGEVFAASDVQAIIAYTKQVIYLDDGDIAVIEKDQVRFQDIYGNQVKREPVRIHWNADLIEKRGFPHFMLKEIFEQPRAVAQALEPFIDLAETKISLKGFSSPPALDTCSIKSQTQLSDILQNFSRLTFVACGTSYYAACVAKYLFESLAKVSVEVDIASEFRYRNPVIEPGSVVFVISQSGETADTLAALRLAKQKGATVLSICNVIGSTIDRESDAHFYMNSGPEIGVASTKAFVSTLAVLNALAIYVGRLRETLTISEEQELVRSLLSVASHMEGLFSYDKFFREAAETFQSYRGFLYMARGINYPIALEGALKLKELAYLHAEGYAAGEMKHGPLALIDEKMAVVMIAVRDELYKKTLSNLEEVRARGAQVIAIGTGQDDLLKNLSVHYLALPEVHWSCYPLLAVVPLQLLAYHMAVHLGHDVDQPRNLAKSVTVE